MSETTYTTVKVATITISVMSMIGNAMICHVIVRLRNMKTSINYIILNLAILDTISGFLTIFFLIANDHNGILGKPLLQQAYNHSPALAEAFCKVAWAYWFVFNVSPLFLMAMAYEKYKAMASPFSRLNKEVTFKRLKWILVLSWISGFGYLTFDMIIVKYENESVMCRDEMYAWYNYKAYLLVLIFTQYIVPSIVIFILYLRLICTLRKNEANTLGIQEQMERLRRKSKKKVMWIIIAVTLVYYIFCGIPQIVYIFKAVYGINFIHFDLVRDLPALLLSINSAVNPFVYFIFIQSFRDGFKTVFMPKRENSKYKYSFKYYQSNPESGTDGANHSRDITLLSFNVT